MFAALWADFGDRVQEVNRYFEMLMAMDNGEIAVQPVPAGQVLKPGPMPPDCGPMLKGAAYLVLYNLAEAFVRRGFQALFEAIRADGLCGTELTDSMCGQWVGQRIRSRASFDGSPKVYAGIAREIIGEVIGKKAALLSHHHLPVSGNLDADLIRDLCHQHGVAVTTDPKAKGGGELNTVKKLRNALSHGDQSFAACGRNVTVAELNQAKDEIVLFVRGILENVEAVVVARSYRR